MVVVFLKWHFKGNLKQRLQVLGNKVARDGGWDLVVGSSVGY